MTGPQQHPSGQPALGPAPLPAPGPPARKPPTLMRSLGLFVGHVARGFSTKVERPAGQDAPGATAESPRRIEVARTVEESRGESPAGPVTLRRTVIEEIVLPAAGGGAAADAVPGPRPAGDAGNRDASARE